MKPKSRLTLAVLGLVSSVSVITAALALGNHIPGQLNSLITGLGGALGGISVTAILLELADRNAPRNSEKNWPGASTTSGISPSGKKPP